MNCKEEKRAVLPRCLAHALTPGWSPQRTPQEARAVRRNVKPILLLQLQFVHLFSFNFRSKLKGVAVIPLLDFDLSEDISKSDI